MNRKSDQILVYLLFGSFFMGIFTLQVFFFVLVLWNWVVVSLDGDWAPGSWLKRHGVSLAFWCFMLASAVYQQASGLGDDFGFHWAFYAFWLLTARQVAGLDFKILHRVLLFASVPGLIYSFYWLLRPEMIEWALGGDNRFSMYPRAAGFLSNPITHAEGLVVLLGWGLARLQTEMSSRERRWMVVHMVASLLIILGSRVRAGVLGFLVLLLLHGIFSPKHRKLCISLVVLMVAAFPITYAVFGFNTDSLTERLVLIQHNLELLWEHLMFGIGPDRFHVYPLPETPDIPSHPHNTLIGVATEMGLPGLFFFLAFMVVVGGRLLLLNRRCEATGCAPAWVARALTYSFGVFWLLGLFDYNFADTELLILHCLLWGVMDHLAARCEVPVSSAEAMATPLQAGLKPQPAVAFKNRSM